MPQSSLMPDDAKYAALLDDLKTRIQSAQVKAALAVNRELILLYWQIGREILTRQQEQGWGAKVIDQLSQDLKREFPDMKGFSARNLKYMRTLANEYPDLEFGQQAVAQIPWGHNCVLLDKVQDPEERKWYIQKTIEKGWSRTILLAQIETGLYQSKRRVVTNFERTLPPPQSELAREVLKDPYNFDFLTIAEDAEAKDLKRSLVEHMRDFLLELGVGFSFLGHNYRLDVNGEDFYLDMLFYHLKLRCYVVIQLEMDEFKPEYSGRMNFYLSAVDRQEREEQDQPTIGIILCKTRNKVVVEYALDYLQRPIAVATHKLPSVERLQSELEIAVQMLEVEGEILEVKAQPDDSSVTPEELTEVALEIQRRLKLLQEMNPTASKEELSAFFTAEMRQQAVSALQSLGKAAVKELLDDAYADTAIAMIESWCDADH
ncbi:MAG: PDDEXK nuclease domain-containing protein [Cyanobacteria bacterium J06639_14]